MVGGVASKEERPMVFRFYVELHAHEKMDEKQTNDCSVPVAQMENSRGAM